MATVIDDTPVDREALLKRALEIMDEYEAKIRERMSSRMYAMYGAWKAIDGREGLREWFARYLRGLFNYFPTGADFDDWVYWVLDDYANVQLTKREFTMPSTRQPSYHRQRDWDVEEPAYSVDDRYYATGGADAPPETPFDYGYC